MKRERKKKKRRFVEGNNPYRVRYDPIKRALHLGSANFDLHLNVPRVNKNQTIVRRTWTNITPGTNLIFRGFGNKGSREEHATDAIALHSLFMASPGNLTNTLTQDSISFLGEEYATPWIRNAEEQGTFNLYHLYPFDASIRQGLFNITTDFAKTNRVKTHIAFDDPAPIIDTGLYKSIHYKRNRNITPHLFNKIESVLKTSVNMDDEQFRGLSEAILKFLSSIRRTGITTLSGKRIKNQKYFWFFNSHGMETKAIKITLNLRNESNEIEQVTYNLDYSLYNRIVSGKEQYRPHKFLTLSSPTTKKKAAWAVILSIAEKIWEYSREKYGTQVFQELYEDEDEWRNLNPWNSRIRLQKYRLLFAEFQVVLFQINGGRGTQFLKDYFTLFSYQSHQRIHLSGMNLAYKKLTSFKKRNFIHFAIISTKHCLLRSLFYALIGKTTYEIQKALLISGQNTQKNKDKLKTNITSLYNKIIRFLLKHPDTKNYYEGMQMSGEELVLKLEYVPLILEKVVLKSDKYTFQDKKMIFSDKKIILYEFRNNAPDVESMYNKSEYRGKKYVKGNQILRIAILNGIHAVPIIKSKANHRTREENWFPEQLYSPVEIGPNDYEYRGEVQQEILPILAKTKKNTYENSYLNKLVSCSQKLYGIPNSKFTQKYVRTPNILYWDLETLNDQKTYRIMLEKELYKQSVSKIRKATIQKIIDTLEAKIGVVGTPDPYSLQVKNTNSENNTITRVYLDKQKYQVTSKNVFGRFFLEMINKNRFSLKESNVMLAHNSGRFDSYFLLSWLMSQQNPQNREEAYPLLFNIQSIIYRQGIQNINFEIQDIRNKKRYTVNVRDTMKFMMMPLAIAAKIFGTGLEKGDLSYESIASWEDVAKYEKEITEYGVSDVDILQIAYEKYIKAYQEKAFGVHIANFSSPTRLIKLLLYSQYFYKNYNPAQDISRWSPPEYIDARSRPHYYGGRTEPFSIGVWEAEKVPALGTEILDVEEILTKENLLPKESVTDIVYEDVTSFYPWVISTFPMPEGKPEIIYLPQENAYFKNLDFNNHKQIALWLKTFDKYFFIEIFFWHTEEAIASNIGPLFPVRLKNGQLIFPHVKYTAKQKYLLTKDELKILVEHSFFGMKIELAQYAIVFPYTTTDYKSFVDYFFREKANLDIQKKKESDPNKLAWIETLRSAMKLLINGSYGFKGQKSEVVSHVVMRDVSNVQEELYTKLLNAKVTKEDDTGSAKLFTYESKLISSERNLFHAIFVTNLARIHLYILLFKQASNSLYCDTDSVIAQGYTYDSFEEQIVNNHPVYKHRDQELGGLTRETGPIAGVVILAPKIYGLLHWSWDKKNKKWVLIETVKFKGFNKKQGFLKKEIVSRIREEKDELNNKIRRIPEKVLVFTGAYSNNWFKEQKLIPQKLCYNDLKKVALGEVAGIEVEIERFQFGMTNITPNKYERSSRTIYFTCQNNKSTPCKKQYAWWKKGVCKSYKTLPFVLT